MYPRNRSNLQTQSRYRSSSGESRGRKRESVFRFLGFESRAVPWGYLCEWGIVGAHRKIQPGGEGGEAWNKCKLVSIKWMTSDTARGIAVISVVQLKGSEKEKLRKNVRNEWSLISCSSSESSPATFMGWNDLASLPSQQTQTSQILLSKSNFSKTKSQMHCIAFEWV